MSLIFSSLLQPLRFNFTFAFTLPDFPQPTTFRRQKVTPQKMQFNFFSTKTNSKDTNRILSKLL